MGKLHPTPALMERAYEYLRASPPINRWGLPHADEVEFNVIRIANTRGYCRSHFEGGKWHHEIAISAGSICRTDSLLTTMAHEMVHEKCDRLGIRTKHGAKFMELAKKVCEVHGFDPKLF